MADARWQMTAERLFEAQLYTQRALVKVVGSLVAVNVIVAIAAAVQSAYVPDPGEGDFSINAITILVVAVGVLVAGLISAWTDWSKQTHSVESLEKLRSEWSSQKD